MLTWSQDIYIYIYIYYCYSLHFLKAMYVTLSFRIVRGHDITWAWLLIDESKGFTSCVPNRQGHYIHTLCIGKTINGRVYLERGWNRKGMKWRRWTSAYSAIRSFICIVSVTNALHLTSFIVIEIIVYLYMHYLLSRRAKGLWTRPFSGNIDEGKTPKLWGNVAMIIFEVSTRGLCFES